MPVCARAGGKHARNRRVVQSVPRRHGQKRLIRVFVVAVSKLSTLLKQKLPRSKRPQRPRHLGNAGSPSRVRVYVPKCGRPAQTQMCFRGHCKKCFAAHWPDEAAALRKRRREATHVATCAKCEQKPTHGLQGFCRSCCKQFKPDVFLDRACRTCREFLYRGPKFDHKCEKCYGESLRTGDDADVEQQRLVEAPDFLDEWSA